jgi:hypothetical protein
MSWVSARCAVAAATAVAAGAVVNSSRAAELPLSRHYLNVAPGTVEPLASLTAPIYGRQRRRVILIFCCFWPFSLPHFLFFCFSSMHTVPKNFYRIGIMDPFDAGSTCSRDSVSSALVTLQVGSCVHLLVFSFFFVKGPKTKEKPF